LEREGGDSTRSDGTVAVESTSESPAHGGDFARMTTSDEIDPLVAADIHQRGGDERGRRRDVPCRGEANLAATIAAEPFRAGVAWFVGTRTLRESKDGLEERCVLGG
jgi:hypothetical protein